MNNWWSAYLNTCKYRLGTASPFTDSWSSICKLAADRHTISPRFLAYVENLSFKATNRILYKTAIRTLRDWPSYVTLSHALAD